MDLDGCSLPDDLLYDLENDLWVRPGAPGGAAQLGVTSWLAGFAGRFTAITFRPVGGVVTAGRSVATLESFRYTGAVRLPTDGVIEETNRALAEQPKAINNDPYGAGWIVRWRPSDPDQLRRRLEPSAAIVDRLREKISVWRIRCYAAVPDLELYEIGTECSAILARIDEEFAHRAADEVLLLVTDDPTSPIELVRWSDRTGHSLVQHRVEGQLHHFLLRKEAHPSPRRAGAAAPSGR